MPEERTSTPAEEDQQVDHTIVLLLLDPESQRPWSEQEIEREIGCDVTDSLAQPCAAGLIHRHGSFAWATRAALVADTIGVPL
ncbi:MAG: hypothetical protein ACHQHO_13250 [Solirubrobacterales bacterium]